MRKWISLACAVLLLVCLLPVEALAAGSFRVAVINLDAALGAGAESLNLPKLTQYAREAGEKKASLVLFPEYALNSLPEEAIDLEENASVAALSAEARSLKLYLVFGAVIREEGKIYSAGVVCSPGGRVSAYKKIHLSDAQYAAGFSAGDTPYLLTTSFGRFGLTLGSEFRDAAELSKYYFYKNCRMVLSLNAEEVPSGDADALSRAQYELWCASYAYEYMYGTDVAAANLCTRQDDALWFGGSHVCSSFSALAADTVSGSDRPGAVYADIPENSYGVGNTVRQPWQLADWYQSLTTEVLPDYGEDGQYADQVTAAAVNFHPVWGDVDANAESIRRIMAEAHQQGVQLLAFPELALTGYSVASAATCPEELRTAIGGKCMQRVMAQVIRGDQPSAVVAELQALAEEYGMYVLIGMPERDEKDPDLYYNSAAILGPGLRTSYRKVNPVSPETTWCTAGSSNRDGVFETPFGYVGVGICADIYHYQELQRTYSLQGCRIVVNCTAGAGNDSGVVSGGWQTALRSRLESFMLRDGTCMLSANLVGYDGPPLSAEVSERLEKAGYTAEDITSAWLRSGAEEFSLLFVRSGKTPGAEGDPQDPPEIPILGVDNAGEKEESSQADPPGFTGVSFTGGATVTGLSAEKDELLGQTEDDPQDEGQEQETQERDPSDSPEDNGYTSLLPVGSTVFPGCSVVLSLNGNSPTGITEYGSDASTAAGRYAALLEGSTAFMSYSADTFNRLYTGSLDLSDALSPILSNPTAYRPGLYAQWYVSLCEGLNREKYVQTLLSDPDTGITAEGLTRADAVLALQTVSGVAEPGDWELNALGIELPEDSAAVFTHYAVGVQSSRSPEGYDGVYAALSGAAEITVPGAEEGTFLLADGEIYRPVNGAFTFLSDLNNGFTVVSLIRSTQAKEADWRRICEALVCWPVPGELMNR